MYQLPKLNIPKQKTDTIAEFKGLNQRASIADNELADCYNISLENYPALSVRDGYEVYIAPTSPNEIMRAKSVRGNMLVERNGQQFQWSFIAKETGLCTASVDLSESDYPIGMDLYNNQLFFLSTPEFGSFDGESEEDWNFCIYSYFWDDGVMLPCNVYLISNSNIFKEFDSKIPTWFFGFGDRMLIGF